MAALRNNTATMSITEVNALMSNMTISTAKKIEMLKAANYKKTDIENLIFIHGLKNAKVEKIIKNYSIDDLTFGVELETLCLSRSVLESRMIDAGVICQIENYNHNNSKTSFKIVADCSVKADGKVSAEIVSPILKGKKGLVDLKKVCEVLNTNTTVNKTCGLHVHVGAENFTVQQFRNLYINMYRLENLIDSFMPISRRENTYCKSYSSISNYESRINLCNNTAQIADVFCNHRYFKINPVSYTRHKTVEFRQHGGTTEFEKVEMWVNFLRKLVVYSRTNRVENVRSVNDLTFLNETEKTFFNNRVLKFA